MGRNRKSTRRTPKARPQGVLDLAPSGFGFVSTAEGEFFIPASKLGGACHGDVVEVAPAKVNASHKSAGRGKGAGGAQGKGTAQGTGRSAPYGAKTQGQRPSARVLRVVHRAHDSIVGRYEVADPFGVVVPEDPHIPFDVFTMRSDNPHIPDGAIVRVRMVEYPSRNTAATGVVEEVLGMDGEPGMDVEAIIARHRLETRFSDAALAEAAGAQVDMEEALAAGYVDERDRFTFTIDPFDAKDFDDALSLEVLQRDGPREGPSAARPADECASGPHCIEKNATRLEEVSISKPSRGPSLYSTFATSTMQVEGYGVQTVVAAPSGSSLSASKACYRLGVHIADVSHYVPWGSAVDADARKRATSVYLVDRVLPMLPESLSNDVCSLKPAQPRRVFTVDMVLDADFKVLSVDCHLSIIESKARLSYDQAQCFIDAALHGETWQEAKALVQDMPVPQGALPLDDATHEQIFNVLQILNRFARARAHAREAAGGLDFETTEAKVQLDAEGYPTDVVLRTRTAATSCVEEAMILANECVAKRLRDTHTPGLFRVHDAPTADALSALIPILQEFGYDKHVALEDFVAGKPQALQAVLIRAQGRAEAPLITNLLLRAQQRAVYKPECLGHYGLALESYCHFTSPIRRYPDLVVHRMLRTLVQGRRETYTQECDSLPWLAEHTSDMERLAETAARESQETKLVEYMQQFIGQEFGGLISGVASYGLFVQLNNTAEGLVPTRALGGEYFSFDPAAYKLTGQDTGRIFRLGQRVQVRVQPSSPHARKLEFSLA